MPKCRNCKAQYTRTQTMQTWCSIDCAIAIARTAQRKAYDKETRRLKHERNAKDKDYWEDKAKTACHKYIRERDVDLPCISCGRFHGGQYHAGHYRPSGVNSAVRYDARNIHKQCAPCNNNKSGNLTEYRKSLIDKVGVEVVEWLDNNHEVKRWTIAELQQVEAMYKDALNRLKAMRADGMIGYIEVVSYD